MQALFCRGLTRKHGAVKVVPGFLFFHAVLFGGRICCLMLREKEKM
jgi:hypothetical protein